MEQVNQASMELLEQLIFYWLERSLLSADMVGVGEVFAMRAKGMGAQVIVTEVDPVKALEALMDGFLVMTLKEAIKQADVVLSTTGDKHVIDEEHLKAAKPGVILANAGHFDVEINKDAMKKLAKKLPGSDRWWKNLISEQRKSICWLKEGWLI